MDCLGSVESTQKTSTFDVFHLGYIEHTAYHLGIYRTEVPGSTVINLDYDVIDVLHTRLDSLSTADQLVLSSK